MFLQYITEIYTIFDSIGFYLYVNIKNDILRKRKHLSFKYHVIVSMNEFI